VSSNKFTHINLKIIRKDSLKQSVISVAFKTLLKNNTGICIYTTSFLYRPGGYIGFTPSCPTMWGCEAHILQQNCVYESMYEDIENF